MIVDGIGLDLRLSLRVNECADPLLFNIMSLFGDNLCAGFVTINVILYFVQCGRLESVNQREIDLKKKSLLF